MINLYPPGALRDSHSITAIHIIVLLTMVYPSLAKQVDFDACYANDVTQLNNSDTSDPLQCFKWDPTHTNRTDTDQTFLSLTGCYQLCGHGFQYYSTSDIVFHLVLFVVPLVSLGGRVAFAPGSISAVFSTIIHLLGDPIDAIWSTLTRQEKTRRNYHVALEIAPIAAREVAAVWTAYDQWWQDPVTVFEKKLKGRNLLQRTLLSKERYRANRAETDLNLNQPNQTGSDKHSNVSVPDLLKYEELFYIKRAARDLTNNRCVSHLAPSQPVPVHEISNPNRSNHPITSWFAIVLFVSSMTAGYIHLATSHTTNDVSHALAVLTLFFFLLFAVYITGNVGNFRHSERVIATIFDISKKYPDLFPLPRLLPDRDPKTKLPTFGLGNITEREFTMKYEEIQAFAGLNSSWRPRKHLVGRNSADRKQPMLCTLSVIVVLISWAAAFLLSYMTPVWGLGCRSGSWTVITIAWILSALADFVMQWIGVDILGKEWEEGRKALTQRTAHVLWWITLAKDLLITLCMLVLIGLSQVGYFNTCWCMASMFFRPQSKMDKVCIYLGPLPQQERDQNWIKWLVIPITALILIHGIIFWASWEGEGGRLLYLRTKTERLAEDSALENMRRRLFRNDDSDRDEEPRSSRYGNHRTNLSVSDAERSPYGSFDQHRGYGALPTGSTELEVRPESSQSPPGVTSPRPSLSPWHRQVSQEWREPSRDPSATRTPLSETHSADPLLRHSP